MEAANEVPGDCYEIRVEGPLPDQWSYWFPGLSLTQGPDGESVLYGEMIDQAALHGALAATACEDQFPPGPILG